VGELTTELLGEQRQLDTTLPPQVEVVLGRNGRRDLVVHLLNLSGARRRTFAAPLPVHGATLILRGLAGTGPVRALRAGRECAARQVDGGLEVRLPPLGRFEVLTLEQGVG
jgi:hypothetical protein